MRSTVGLIFMGAALLACSGKTTDHPPGSSSGQPPGAGGQGAPPCEEVAYAVAVQEGESSFGALSNASIIAGAVLIKSGRFPLACLEKTPVTPQVTPPERPGAGVMP